MTQEFTPSDDEQQLYEWVSEYLQRPNLNALPAGQRTLMTLVMRKLLSSSTYAIAGALNSIALKLEKKLHSLSVKNESEYCDDIIEDFAHDYDSFNDEADEWIDEEGETYTNTDREALITEMHELKSFRDLAVSIVENSKGEKLLTALSSGFQKIEELGGVRKAVIFTESRRTQEYVLKILSETEYEGKIVLFNGSNNDAKSKEVYKAWLEKHKGTDKITGSRTADMRAALVDYFREEAVILIATEAAAEGINLQFCSFIVNYDMPWNPQRIEQRIGRCHRYGQKFDVVVLNFLNRKNAADVRVYELLNDKFRLFEGVFGASDEVLGAIESGVDFEKQILAIYQNCRTQDEIKDAFDQLQAQFQESISTEMHNTRQKLLENFDEEVHDKLKVAKEKSETLLSTHKQRLFGITKKALAGYADFEDGGFILNTVPDSVNAAIGRYTLSQDENLGHRYRIGLPLAHYAINQAQNLETGNVEILFNYTGLPKVSVIEPFIGKSGWMMIKKVTIDSFETIDEIIVSCVCDDGSIIEPEIARRFFSVDGEVVRVLSDTESDSVPESVHQNYSSLFKEFTGWLAAENSKFFDEEMTKLEAWAEDLKKSLEIEIKQLDVEIKTRKTESRKITELAAKVAEQRDIKKLESQRNEKRKKLFNAQDQIEEKKDGLIDNIESRMNQEITETELFTIRWELRG